MATDTTIPDPAIVLDLLTGFRRSKVMFVAVSMGVFDALTDGPKTLAALSEEMRATPDALERLLDACVGLQLLRHSGDDEQDHRRQESAPTGQSKRYENTPVAAAYLRSTSPRRLTGYINRSNDMMWQLWGNLEGAVREGTARWKQTYGWEGPIFSHFFKTEHDKREFLMGMHGFGLISSPQVVATFDLSRFTRLADLGGATGHLAIAACQRYPNLRAVVFDLPEAIPLAQEIVSASPVAERIEIRGGDFFVDPLPEADLYAVGRILHDWSEEKVLRLLRRMHDALPPNGAVLIAEKLLYDDKSGPSWAQMQNLNMLTCTEGKERTLAEYESLLTQAGFATVLGCRTPSPLDAILATK